jgi:transposase
LVPPPDDEHDCGWKAYSAAQGAKLDEQNAKLNDLTEKLAAVTAKLEELSKRSKGHQSERRRRPKMPPPVPPKSDRAEAEKKRREAAEIRNTKLESEIIAVPVPPDACRCPTCGGDEKIRNVGFGKPSTVYEYIPGYFRRRIFQRQTLACRCGYIVTAPAPDRVAEKTRYAASFIAHLIVAKCSSSMPQYRLEKEYRNICIPMSRSTMCSLFHRGADELKPLYRAALALVPAAPDVHADETSIRQIDIKKKAFFWDFVTPDLIVYCYAASRSGDTPKRVLGDSQGRLVVDQHTGYNAITKPGKRTRAGCLAHARRKIFENSEHPEAQEALDLIGEIYLVEREAKEAGIVGTDAHLALRKARSRSLFAKLLRWGRRHRHSFEPGSGIAKAIRYLLRNYEALGCFLRYATIPPDNNPAEAGLRRIAVGRSNYLFVGHKESGEDHAVLYTLVASCEKNGVNPVAYLTDVLTRVQTHPASKIQELLPHRWKPPDLVSIEPRVAPD